MRVGIGYDVHQLTEGRPLVIGGGKPGLGWPVTLTQMF